MTIPLASNHEYQRVYHRERRRGNPNAKHVARHSALLLRLQIDPEGTRGSFTVEQFRQFQEHQIAYYSLPARVVAAVKTPVAYADPIQIRLSKSDASRVAEYQRSRGVTRTAALRELISRGLRTVT